MRAVQAPARSYRWSQPGILDLLVGRELRRERVVFVERRPEPASGCAPGGPGREADGGRLPEQIERPICQDCRIRVAGWTARHGNPYDATNIRVLAKDRDLARTFLRA